MDRPLDETLWQTSALLARARDGDSAAHDSLYAVYYPRIQSFVHGRLPAFPIALDETSDAAQEVWLKVISALPGFEDRGVGSFWAWLRSIAHNYLIDQGRRAARRAPPVALGENQVEEPAAARRSPPSEMLQREELDRFEAALQHLGERERQAFLMRIEMDLGFQEIARDLGYATHDAARKAVSRATLKMAERLEDA